MYQFPNLLPYIHLSFSPYYISQLIFFNVRFHISFYIPLLPRYFSSHLFSHIPPLASHFNPLNLNLHMPAAYPANQIESIGHRFTSIRLQRSPSLDLTTSQYKQGIK